MKKMQETLVHQDFAKFKALDKRLLDRVRELLSSSADGASFLHFFSFFQVDRMLADDIAKLMAMIPIEEKTKQSEGQDRIEGGAFDGVMDKATPFMYKGGEGVNAGLGEVEWVIAKDRFKYDAVFDTLNPIDGKVTGACESTHAVVARVTWRYILILPSFTWTAAKQEMIKSKLPNNVLGKIWKLSDVDKDGMLDADEFALAMHLMNIKLDGHDLPTELPQHLMPPSKRGNF